MSRHLRRAAQLRPSAITLREQPRAQERAGLAGNLRSHEAGARGFVAWSPGLCPFVGVGSRHPSSPQHLCVQEGPKTMPGVVLRQPGRVSPERNAVHRGQVPRTSFVRPSACKAVRLPKGHASPAWRLNFPEPAWGSRRVLLPGQRSPRVPSVPALAHPALGAAGRHGTGVPPRELLPWTRLLASVLRRRYPLWLKLIGCSRGRFRDDPPLQHLMAHCVYAPRRLSPPPGRLPDGVHVARVYQPKRLSARAAGVVQ